MGNKKCKISYSAESGIFTRRQLLLTTAAAAFLPTITAIAKTTLRTDANIAYQVLGRGDISIVFVHGWSCDSTYWSEQLDYFSQKYQVITIDLGGHGASDVVRDDYTIESFGDDVVTVLDQINSDKFILVGHSMGGPVVVDAAGKFGNRIEAVVGVDTLKNVDTEPLSKEAARQAWAPFADDFENSIAAFVRNSFFIETSPPELINRVSSDMASADPRIALSAGAGLATYDTPAAVKKIANIPLTLINAAEDPTSIEALDHVHGNYNVIIIPDCGHFVMMEKQDQFNDTLSSEIERLAIQ